MPNKQEGPSLRLPRTDVSDNISKQIDKGLELQRRDITSKSNLEQVKADRDVWVSYTTELLRRSFDNSSIAEGFERVQMNRLIRSQAPLATHVEYFRDSMGGRISNLRGILERLPLIPEVQPFTPAIGTEANSSLRPNVFVVHGHDMALKSELARFIERLGLTAIILDEQPSQGRTIIEKFEHYAASVGFAIVLLTPDDVSALKVTPAETREQARPNVLFELGYFVGSLGRGKVCLLRKSQTDIPSDLFGVVYISVDSGDWQVRLAREMKATNMAIDLNRLV